MGCWKIHYLVWWIPIETTMKLVNSSWHVWWNQRVDTFWESLKRCSSQHLANSRSACGSGDRAFSRQPCPCWRYRPIAYHHDVCVCVTVQVFLSDRDHRWGWGRGKIVHNSPDSCQGHGTKFFSHTCHAVESLHGQVILALQERTDWIMFFKKHRWILGAVFLTGQFLDRLSCQIRRK